MLYLIIGMIIGSLYAIIMGPTTIGGNLPLSLETFSPLGFFIGIIILFILEIIKIRTEKNGSMSNIGETR